MEKAREKESVTPQEIGGFLILPMLGLIFTPLRQLFALVTTMLPIFTSDSWEALTSKDSSLYHVLWGPLITMEVLGTLVFTVFPILLLILFFKKKYNFPKLMIIFYLSNTIFVLLDHFISQTIPLVASLEVDPETIKNLVSSLSASAIWVPYFFLSKRVKETFVVGRE